jgi:hypothetical protein
VLVAFAADGSRNSTLGRSLSIGRWRAHDRRCGRASSGSAGTFHRWSPCEILEVSWRPSDVLHCESGSGATDTVDSDDAVAEEGLVSGDVSDSTRTKQSRDSEQSTQLGELFRVSHRCLEPVADDRVLRLKIDVEETPKPRAANGSTAAGAKSAAPRATPGSTRRDGRVRIAVIVPSANR